MDGADVFWDLATDVIGRNGVEEGTMMSSRCLRANGEFFAMPDRHSGGLIVKLPAERVSELIEKGLGSSFAPAGKVFKEWVLIPPSHTDVWLDLMADARDFVS